MWAWLGMEAWGVAGWAAQQAAVRRSLATCHLSFAARGWLAPACQDRQAPPAGMLVAARAAASTGCH